MADAYGWADLVLCRAGALTVAERAIMGRPSLLVPLPHAIDDHQTANARALTDRGAGILLKQSELSATRLQGILQSYLSHPERLAIMAAAARDAAHPDATRNVADRCIPVMILQKHGADILHGCIYLSVSIIDGVFDLMVRFSFINCCTHPDRMINTCTSIDD